MHSPLPPVRERPAPGAETLDAPRPAAVGGWNLLRRAWQQRAAERAGPGRLAVARSRRLRRGGRSVMLWSLALFVAAQAALLLATYWWRPTSYRAVAIPKWRRLRQLAASEPDRPLLLMIGSSRTEMAFDAGQLNGLPGPNDQPLLAYNFGMPAVGALQEHLSLRELLEAGIRPRYLLVEFLPPLLNKPYGRNTSEENWIVAPWLSGRQLVRLWPYFRNPRDKGLSWLEARVSPWYVFRPQIQTLVKDALYPEQALPMAAPHDAWGHEIQGTPTAADWMYKGWKAYDTYHGTLGSLRVGKGPARAMRDLVDLCRRERIPVALVVMPESTIFRSWYCPEGLAEVRHLLAELRDRHGAFVIDANDWVADRDFSDGHHVTSAGARVFTARLRNEVRRWLSSCEKAGQ